MTDIDSLLVNCVLLIEFIFIQYFFCMHYACYVIDHGCCSLLNSLSALWAIQLKAIPYREGSTSTRTELVLVPSLYVGCECYVKLCATRDIVKCLLLGILLGKSCIGNGRHTGREWERPPPKEWFGEERVRRRPGRVRLSCSQWLIVGCNVV